MNNKKLIFRLLPIIGLTSIIVGYIYIMITGMRLDTDLKAKESELAEKQAACDNLDRLIAKKNEAYRLLQETNESVVEIASQNSPGSASEIDSVIEINQQEIYNLEKETTLSFTVTPRKERDLDKAKEWEEKGFSFLKEKNIEQAIDAFKNSENAYNGFHNVYDITLYLEKNKAKLADPNSEEWEILYAKMVSDFSYKMPQHIKTDLRSRSTNLKPRTGIRKQ
ncbi:MAG: hypothetical protein QE487_07645 [Fluviicola sp.]|nr:hypothetical protein [Fluviicola sp.]